MENIDRCFGVKSDAASGSMPAGVDPPRHPQASRAGSPLPRNAFAAEEQPLHIAPEAVRPARQRAASAHRGLGGSIDHEAMIVSVLRGSNDKV